MNCVFNESFFIILKNYIEFNLLTKHSESLENCSILISKFKIFYIFFRKNSLYQNINAIRIFLTWVTNKYLKTHFKFKKFWNFLNANLFENLFFMKINVGTFSISHISPTRFDNKWSHSLSCYNSLELSYFLN